MRARPETARPERVTAYAGLTALALGAAGMAFERAGPSVASASPGELAAWATEHHRALSAQSAVYLTSTAPLLAFFAGLAFTLRPGDGPDRLARSVGVLAGGATWLGFQAAAQTEQLGMARAAAHDAGPQEVASRGSRMRALLRTGNAALAGSLAATATAPRTDLPGWLRGLSAAAAAAHLAPAMARRRGGAPLEVLPYPLFVAWLVGVVTVLGRRSRRAGS